MLSIAQEVRAPGVMDGSALGGGHEERGEGEHVQCG